MKYLNIMYYFYVLKIVYTATKINSYNFFLKKIVKL